MQVQIKPWGNSQGIRLSKEQLAASNIQMGEILELEISDGCIVLKKAFRHRTLEERAKAFHGKVGPYREFDWEEPVGREVW